MIDDLQIKDQRKIDMLLYQNGTVYPAEAF